MQEQGKRPMAEVIADFHLPRYREITDVGLYLEQVTRFVNTRLEKLGCGELTPSMVSNYVKQKTIPGPVKKAYGVDSVAYLIFVAVIKAVLSMEDIRMLISLQQQTYALPVAYDYFCEEFENLLQVVFGLKSEPDKVGVDSSRQKEILRAALLTVTHQIYLDSFLKSLRESEEGENPEK